MDHYLPVLPTPAGREYQNPTKLSELKSNFHHAGSIETIAAEECNQQKTTGKVLVLESNKKSNYAPTPLANDHVPGYFAWGETHDKGCTFDIYIPHGSLKHGRIARRVHTAASLFMTALNENGHTLTPNALTFHHEINR